MTTNLLSSDASNYLSAKINVLHTLRLVEEDETTGRPAEEAEESQRSERVTKKEA